MNRWVIAGYACPWLIFILILQSVELYKFADTGQWGQVALGGVLLAGFIATYLLAFMRSVRRSLIRPLPRTLAYCLVLILITAAMSWQLGTPMITTVTYILAVWVYRTPVKAGILGVLVGVTIVMILAVVTDQVIVGAVITVGCIAFLFQRISIDAEDSLVGMTHELDLSRQREDIARNVHDTVGHYLTATHVKAQLVAKLICVVSVHS